MASRSPATLPTVIVAGPTASGKSALALRLAEELDGVVINADSMQIYRELHVLTARPSADEQARVPHRLYGVLAAAEVCSAARWRDLALAEVTAARAAAKVPIIVGGTGLYLRTLKQGIADIPAIPPDLRERLRAEQAAQGQAAFHARLAVLDPASAASIRPSDPQRTLRAMEVLAATGESLRAWQGRGGDVPKLDSPAAWIWLDPPRELLRQRAETRFRQMVEQGALEEVRALLALKLDPALPAMKALGVPELVAHLRGEIDLAPAIDRAVLATRRYAKRQTTWFRHQLPPERLQIAQFSESLEGEILSFIRRIPLTELG